MQHRKILWGVVALVGFIAVAVVLYKVFPEEAGGNGQNEITIADNLAGASSTSSASITEIPVVATDKTSKKSLGGNGSTISIRENVGDGDDNADSQDSAAAVGGQPMVSTSSQALAASSSVVSPSSTVVSVTLAVASSSSAPTSCVFIFPTSTVRAFSRKVIFNEIAWMGSAGASASEWMEIKNISNSEVDLSGWQLLNASGKIKIVFGPNDSVPAGGLLLAARTNAIFANSITVQKNYSGDLKNTGDDLALVDASCGISDLLESSSTGWRAGDNTTKKTMERDADGIGWHTSVLPGGTPGRENSVPSPTVSKINTSFGGSVGVASTPSNEECVSGCVENNASGTDFTAVPSDGNAVTSSTDITTSTLDIIIASSTVGTTTPSDSSLPLDATSTSLVLPSSSPPLASPLVNHLLIAAIQTGGVAANNDLVKIYNPTDGVVDVSGWKLRKRSQTGTDYSIREFSAGTTVLPRSYLVWANSADGFAESVNADVSSTQTLAADNSVALIDANGKTIDAVAWGAGTGQYGEGTPYPTSPVSGQTLARQSANGMMVDTDNNANDFVMQ